MEEETPVAPTLSRPRTRVTLADDLRRLGVRPGSVLLTHASFATLGWICGGPVAVVQALCDVLGPDGTLVVPTHTPENSDPAGWRHPPVPESWWAVIRDQMPGFDPAVTPSRWMGLLAETVRCWPGARRSSHPHVSFAALGRHAREITADHVLDEMLGERSPLGRIYERDGDVLLLGVDHSANTSLHLAEYRQPGLVRVTHGAATMIDARRTWVWWEDVDIDSDDFDRLGLDLDQTGVVRSGLVGASPSRLMRQRDAVDFAVGWLATHRPPTLTPSHTDR